METNPTYEASTLPKTLGEVLRALSAPFPEEQCAWRILTRNGPDGNWVWVKYPVGEFMKLRLARSCSGGYNIIYEEGIMDERKVIEAALVIYDPERTLVIYDPERTTEHHMTLTGIRELSPNEDLLAARTYALKDACEQAGMGVGAGERAYTPPYRNPDGEQTDKNGVPISEYHNGNMTGQRQDSGGVLTTAEAVKAWLTSVANKADAAAHRATHVKALAQALEDLEFNPRAVMIAAWGEPPPTTQQVIATRQLASRTNAKEEIQLLLEPTY